MGKPEKASQKKKAQDMLSGDAPLRHHPFDSLKELKRSSVAPPASPVQQPPQKEEAPSDDQLFLEAMKGVSPVSGNQVVSGNVTIRFQDRGVYVLEDDDLSRLARLVSHGEGFVVADTPEYMEGTGYHVKQEFARRLHEGDFAIKAHIDLHGMNVEKAGKEFEAFMKDAYLSGKRAVLVVHGRGLSSPGEAILKNKVREWLSQSYWRKRVLAYASAQSHDGGAGATYVLFRERPVSKKSAKLR